MRRPVSWIAARIAPVAFFSTASGLMIDSVRSTAMARCSRSGCASSGCATLARRERVRSRPSTRSSRSARSPSSSDGPSATCSSGSTRSTIGRTRPAREIGAEAPLERGDDRGLLLDGTRAQCRADHVQALGEQHREIRLDLRAAHQSDQDQPPADRETTRGWLRSTARQSSRARRRRRGQRSPRARARRNPPCGSRSRHRRPARGSARTCSPIPPSPGCERPLPSRAGSTRCRRRCRRRGRALCPRR